MAVRIVEELRKLIRTSDTLLDTVYVLIKSGHWGLSQNRQPVSYSFTVTYYEIPGKLVNRWPEHPRTIDYEKVDRLGSEVLWRDAPTMLKELQSSWRILQEMATLLETSIRVLALADAEWQPLSLENHGDLLTLLMSLVSKLIRLHLLARRMPYALIVQLYTLTYNCVQVQKKKQNTHVDPPNLVQMVSYCKALATPVAMMQSEFQPVSSRIGQILELAILPAIAAFNNVQGVQESQLLNCISTDEVRRSACASMGFTAEAGLNALRLLSSFREWAVLAILVCPGEAIRPGASRVMEDLLSDTLLLHVYMDITEWLHPLFSKHVQPTLRMHYQQVKSSLRPLERKALQKTANHLIESALNAAQAGAMERHTCFRSFLAIELDRSIKLCNAENQQLPRLAESFFVMLSMARSEVLWLYRHIDEEIPKSWLGSLLTFEKPFRLAEDDNSIPQLLSSMGRATVLLREHMGYVREELTHNVHALLSTQIKPHLDVLDATAAEQSGEGLLNVAAGFRSVADALDSLDPRCQEQGTPVSSGTSDGLVFSGRESMEDAREGWEDLAAELATRGGAVSSATLAEASGSDTLIKEMSLAVNRACMIDAFEANLIRVSGLQDLWQFLPKFRATMTASISGPAASLAHVVGWIYPIPFLMEQLPESNGNEPANQAAHVVLEEWQCLVSSRLEKLLLSLQEVQLPVLQSTESGVHTRPPDLRRSVLAATKKLLHRRPRNDLAGERKENEFTGNELGSSLQNGFQPLSDRTAREETSSSEDRDPERAQKKSYGVIVAHWPGKAQLKKEREQFAKLLVTQQAAQSLVQALGISPHIQVSNTIVEPRELLLRCVTTTARYLITVLAFDGQVIEKPAVLEKSIGHFFHILQKLQLGSGVDLSGAARNVLVEQAYAPLDNDTADQSAGARVVSYIGEWYMRTIIRDTANLGVCFSMSRQTFVSTSKGALDLVDYASEAQLRAFVRVFGLYGARELGYRAGQALEDAIAGLQSVMSACEPVLRGLKEAEQENRVHLAVCSRAASAIPDLQNVVELLRISARCLFLRQLLGRAAIAECQSMLPEATALLSLAAAASPESAACHVCGILDLPQHPQLGPDCLVGPVDPVLARCLAKETPTNPGRLQCFSLWPLLLGLTFWSPGVATAALNPAFGNLLNGLDCIAICAHALAQAMPEACAGGNGEFRAAPDADCQEPREALKSLVRVATCSLMLRSGDSSSSRLLVMNSLTGPGFERSMLEEFHVPLAHVRYIVANAYQQGARKP
eukprot:jgi/Botrbrau1/8316/Bobra.0081s0005.1